MKKIIFEIIITIVLFFAFWIGVSQINWVSILNANELSAETEKKLGELTWKFFKNSESEVEDYEVKQIIDSLVLHINKANDIDHESIKVHILVTDEINAFALPDGHLIINSQLIIDANNQEELLGVISHELAHIKLNHVTKKLAKEVGLSLAISTITGDSKLISEIAHKLSSTAFDRKQESEADLTAVIYLENAKINPLPFADFLDRLSEEENVTSEYLTWISTHPDSKKRALKVKENINQKIKYQQVIDSTTWNKLQNQLSDL